MIRLLLKVVVDGQAWLYANQKRLEAKMQDSNFIMTDDLWESWQDEWKTTTQELLEEEGEPANEEPTSNPS